METRLRKAEWKDYQRGFLFIGVIFVTGAVFFFLLGWVRWLFLPNFSDLKNHWQIGPIYAMRIGAAAFLAIISSPVVIRPFRKRWQAEDQKSGTRVDGTASWNLFTKIKIYFSAVLLIVVYAFGLIIYCTVSTEITPKGIQQSAFFQLRKYQWSDVVRLTEIPEGYRDDRLKLNGPHYWIHLSDGKEIDFSTSNEGLTQKDIQQIVRFLESKTHRLFQRRLRLRKRN